MITRLIIERIERIERRAKFGVKTYRNARRIAFIQRAIVVPFLKCRPFG